MSTEKDKKDKPGIERKRYDLPGKNRPGEGMDDDIITPAGTAEETESVEEQDLEDEDITENENEIEEEEEEEDMGGVVSESDLTKEDLEALGPVDLSMDLGDDEQLKHRTHPVNFSGDDLDVPGAELDDNAENIGEEDEENNSYSIGSDEADRLEDNPDRY